MKILVVGDAESKYLWDFFDEKKLKDVKLIISTGDLNSKFLTYLVTMLNVPLLYVHGNHDTGYLNSPPEGCDNIEDKLIIYKDLRIVGLGGSFRYKPGPFQFTEKEMRKRVKKLRRKLWVNKGFDILVSHAPAYGLGDGQDLCHKGFESLKDLIEKYKPKYFLHGHQHLNYGTQPRIIKYNDTTIINSYQYHIFDY